MNECVQGWLGFGRRIEVRSLTCSYVHRSANGVLRTYIHVSACHLFAVHAALIQKYRRGTDCGGLQLCSNVQDFSR